MVDLEILLNLVKVLTSNTDGRGIIQDNDDKILKILKP
jgi:hypothetical protein